MKEKKHSNSTRIGVIIGLAIICVAIVMTVITMTEREEDYKEPVKTRTASPQNGYITVRVNYPTDFYVPAIDVHIVNVETGNTIAYKTASFFVEDVDLNRNNPLHKRVAVPFGTYVVYIYYDSKDGEKAPSEKDSGIIVSYGVLENPVSLNSPLKRITLAPTMQNLDVNADIDFYGKEDFHYVSEIPPFGESYRSYTARREQLIQEQQEMYEQEHSLRTIASQAKFNAEIEYVNSPDYRYTVYVEWSDEIDKYAAGDGLALQSHINLIDNETGGVKTIVPFGFDRDPQKDMRTFGILFWTPDSNAFYFSTEGWATAGALHRYEIKTGETNFVTSFMGYVSLVEGGEYDGYIRTSHTTTVDEQGRQSYEVVVSPDGKNTIRISENKHLY